MKFLNLAFIAASVLMPLAAQATDLPSKKTAPAAPTVQSKWDGLYAGGRVGYSQAEDYGREYYLSGSDYTWDSYQRSEPSGAVVGGVLGYNKMVSNRFVLGLEIDLEKRFQNATAFQYAQRDSVSPSLGFKMETSIDSALFTRARLGYLINSANTMLYVSAGTALADVKRSFTRNANTDPTTATDNSWQFGWTFGGGIEHYIRENLSMTIDYQYATFAHHELDVTELYGSRTYEYERQDLKEQLLNVGLNYHF